MKKLLILVIACLIQSCGAASENNSNSNGKNSNLRIDELADTNWEFSNSEGKLGYYFDSSGHFARVAYKTTPSVQAMGIRGTYVISNTNEITMTAGKKSCSNFSGEAEEISTYRISEGRLQLGDSGILDFAAVDESFDERFSQSARWGCVSNDGQFIEQPWTPW